MQIIPVKTRAVLPPQDDIYQVIDESCPKLHDGDVFLITSKIVAIHQGRCVPTDSVNGKDELVAKEADIRFPKQGQPGTFLKLTIKNNTFVSAAGIDASNANDYYILWPDKPEAEAKKIYEYLQKKFSLSKLAVIITDSRSTPLRYGTMGISIGCYGLKPLRDDRGTPDIFGRKLRKNKVNVVDALAITGVLAMGEGSEQQPLAIIRGADFVEFTDKETYQDLLIPLEEDIYYPLIQEFHKKSKSS